MQSSSYPESSSELPGEITASMEQIAVLNSMLPRGFRFELCANVKKVGAVPVKAGKRERNVSAVGSL